MAGGSEKGRSTQGGVNISLRQVARELEKKQKEEWGKVLFKARLLRFRYQRRKEGKPVYSSKGPCRLEGRDEFGRFAKGGIPWNSPYRPPASKEGGSTREKVGGSTGSTRKKPVKDSGADPVKPKRGRPPRFTVAMDFATIAISQLSRIEVDDPKRKIAFERVIIWITENRYGRKGDSAW
jgi:hypothetical protein